MRRLWIFPTLALIAILFCPPAALAAGGTCPSATNYVDVSKEGQSGTFNLTLAQIGISSCYFVGPSGLDSNAGTTEGSPFLHIPGTPNFTGSATIGAGVGVIVEGGYVAHFGNTGLSTSTGGQFQPYNGTSTHPSYYGIDPTWYSGGSFVRPQLNGDNPVQGSSGSGTFPASCTYDNSTIGSGLPIRPRGGYLILDGFEDVGWCWSSGTIDMIYTTSGNPQVYVERFYQHGWSTPDTSTDSYYLEEDNAAGANDGDIFALNVIDGTDSSWNTVGGAAPCNWTSVSPTGPCYSGGMVYEGINIIWGNVCTHVSNCIVSNDNWKFHDNYISNMAVSYQNNGQHSNCNNMLSQPSGHPTYFYNNVTTQIRTTECYFVAVLAGQNLYGFNNVFWGNMNYYSSSAPSNCIALNSVGTASSGSPNTLWWYNNTVDQDGGSGGGCEIQFGNANAPLDAWYGPATFQNNHNIGCTNLACTYTVGSSGAVLTVANDNGGEVYQTEVSANSQGYTTSNNYAPTSTGGASYHAGLSQTTFCSAIADSAAQTACASGTTGSVSIGSAWGGETAVYPAITINTRGSNFDAGAYQFESATSTGSAIPAQSVIKSGSVFQ